MDEGTVNLYGAEQEAADWHGGDGMRAKVRQLVNSVRAASSEGPDDAGLGTP